MKCNPEDIGMNSDQDYEKLGRRAQRKIRKKERLARERNKEDSDEEYDRLALKVSEKNKDEKTSTQPDTSTASSSLTKECEEL